MVKSDEPNSGGITTCQYLISEPTTIDYCINNVDIKMTFWINLILGLGVLILIGVQFVKFKLMHKIIASFDNSKDGFSARKLSAFAGVTVSIIATFRFVDTATIIEALMVWLCFALLCLGIVTAEQVIRLRNKTAEPVVEPPKPEDLKKPEDSDPKI